MFGVGVGNTDAERDYSKTGPDAKPPLNVVFVGDSRVGKSSIIQTALTGAWNPYAPPVLPELPLPTSSEVRIKVKVRDTSTNSSYKESRDRCIRKADVIVVVFDASVKESLPRVGSYWLPEIERVRAGKSMPSLLIVGNKIELRPDLLRDDFVQAVLPLMKKYKDIETCLECSCVQFTNVAAVLSYAIKACVYPSKTLYNDETGQLSEKFVKALHKIFAWADMDGDGLLGDDEMAWFQLTVFHDPLVANTLAHLKSEIVAGQPAGITQGKLTLEGFLYVHELFLRKGRADTAWTVVRSFGFDENLEYSADRVVGQLRRNWRVRTAALKIVEKRVKEREKKKKKEAKGGGRSCALM